MKSKKGLLLVCSGPSGSGKGTVLRRLLEEMDNLFYSVSATTRSPRPGEEHGVHYFFLQKGQFEELIEQDGMLEHASYVGNYYGTPKKAVMDRIDRGEHVILEIEVQGAMQVKAEYPDAVMIFILPPSMEELQQRLVGRGTEEESVVRSRMKTAEEEIQQAHKYGYLVVNNTIDDAVETIAAIIKAEETRTERMIETLKEDLPL